MRKAVISTIALVGAAPLLLLGTAQRANAATTCYASSCTGLAASSTTCVSDAYVAEQANIYNGSTLIGNIQLKYSPSCRATWARVISYLSYGSHAWVQSDQNGYLWEECYGNASAGTGCNTTMINDANMTSNAEGRVWYNGGYYNDVTTASF
jgi:hypothetical protein